MEGASVACVADRGIRAATTEKEFGEVKKDLHAAGAREGVIELMYGVPMGNE